MRILVLLLAVSALTGCVPSSENVRPRIAVVNAPTELRFPGLADAFSAALKKKHGATFAFSPPATLRFQETHRDMHGSRAPLQASFIARSQGASYGVMVGLLGVKTARPVAINAEALKVEVTLTGQLQAVLVDPASADAFATFVSPGFVTRIAKVVALELPDGIEFDSPEARVLVEKLVEKVRQETLVRHEEGMIDAPLRQLAAAVAAELVGLTP